MNRDIWYDGVKTGKGWGSIDGWPGIDGTGDVIAPRDGWPGKLFGEI